MFYEHLATTIAGLHPVEVKRREQLQHDVWRAFDAGQLSDNQAQELAERLAPQRPLAAVLPLAGPPKGYFIQRSAEQRSPDREASNKRARMHAASGAMPPQLAAQFTGKEQACLRVMADECLAHGVCDLALNEIAARAGSCKTIAKSAMRRAERMGLITVERRPRSGRKHLSNLRRIVDAAWLDWLSKGNRKHRAIASCRKARPDFRTFRGASRDGQGSPYRGVFCSAVLQPPSRNNASAVR